MSPAGGPGGRRLQGSKRLLMLFVTCRCGEVYEVSRSAVDLAQCPRCRLATRDVPKEQIKPKEPGAD